MAYNGYFFRVLYHPDGGTINLHLRGGFQLMAAGRSVPGQNGVNQFG